MFPRHPLRWFILGLILFGLGCAFSAPVPGVVRPKPGEGHLESLPPMMDFGPFNDYSDALSEACSLFLSKPHASVGHIKDPDLALRVSTEYCAWLYYTPENQYQMSMLTDQSDADDFQSKKKTCRLPAFVDDRRYPPWSIKYIFALHNHPFGGPLSLQDMRKIISLANMHEWVIETKDGRVPIAIVAFFSRPDRASPTCDGFYQYTPETRSLHVFTKTGDGWSRRDVGEVTWINSTTYRLGGRIYHMGGR